MSQSMVRTAYHISEARTALSVAIHHLSAAEAADVDPDVASKVYAVLRTDLRIADLWCDGLVKSRQPDLDRERAAIDAARGRADRC